MGRPLGTTGQAQVLTEPQFKRVISFVKGHYEDNHRLRNITILYISFYLGLRVSEIASLSVSHVFDDSGEPKSYVRLTAPMTKSKRHRDVYVSNPSLIKALKAYYVLLESRYGAGFDHQMPLISSQKRGAFRPKTMGRLIKNMYSLAGFDDATSHSGRRSMITSLIDNGADIKAVSLIAGHKSIGTTAIYAESSPAKLSNIMKMVFEGG